MKGRRTNLRSVEEDATGDKMNTTEWRERKKISMTLEWEMNATGAWNMEFIRGTWMLTEHYRKIVLKSG